VDDRIDEAEDIPVQKEARMTTNKVSLLYNQATQMFQKAYISIPQRKATNFYANANVKNKSRKKAALMRALNSSARTDKSRKRR